MSCGSHTTTKATTLAPSTTTQITASPACGSLPYNLCPGQGGEVHDGYTMYNLIPPFGIFQIQFAYPQCCQDYMECIFGPPPGSNEDYDNNDQYYEFYELLFNYEYYGIGVFTLTTSVSRGLLITSTSFDR